MSRLLTLVVCGTFGLLLPVAGSAYERNSRTKDESKGKQPKLQSQGIRTQDIVPPGGPVTKPVVRDHRTPPVVRDHRAPVVVRDHRDPVIVRDHREPVVVRDHRDPVVVRDHRDPVIVRDHRTPVVVRDHRQAVAKPPVVVNKPRPSTEVTIGKITWPARQVIGAKEPVRLPPAIIGKPKPWSDDASQESGGVWVK